jgi:hypothetical protein
VPTVRRAPLEMQLDAVDYPNAMPFVRHKGEVPPVIGGGSDLPISRTL